MRAALAAIALVGCYGPTAPGGAPCDPLASHCPAGQTCRLVSGAYACTSNSGEPARDATIEYDATVLPDPDAALPDAPSMPVEKTFTASVAECVDYAMPDPAYCRSSNGNQQLVIDAYDPAASGAWVGFVRFDIDTALEGLTVTSVVLRLTVTNHSQADGDQTGSIWRVTPFTLQSLSTTVPTPLDTDPLAPSQGPVLENDVFDFMLPSSLVTPGSPVHLGIAPESELGVHYWNTSGPTPPKLIVTAQ